MSNSIIKNTDETLSVIAGLMGKKGGKSRTARKRKASSLNLAKARSVRLKRLAR